MNEELKEEIKETTEVTNPTNSEDSQDSVVAEQKATTAKPKAKQPYIKPKKKKSTGKMILGGCGLGCGAIFLVLAIIGCCIGGYFWYQHYKTNKELEVIDSVACDSDTIVAKTDYTGYYDGYMTNDGTNYPMGIDLTDNGDGSYGGTYYNKDYHVTLSLQGEELNGQICLKAYTDNGTENGTFSFTVNGDNVEGEYVSPAGKHTTFSLTRNYDGYTPEEETYEESEDVYDESMEDNFEEPDEYDY